MNKDSWEKQVLKALIDRNEKDIDRAYMSNFIFRPDILSVVEKNLGKLKWVSQDYNDGYEMALEDLKRELGV